MILPNIIRWFWDFGDGTTSTLENPEHTYHYMPGSYTVRLTVWDELGNSQTFIYENLVTVYDYDYDGENPNASITDKCYRMPVMMKHGFGPSEYQDSDNPGFDWIWPPAETGWVKVYDVEKNEIALVVDTKTQEIYWMNRPNTLYDRMAGGYSARRRIIAEVHEKAIHAIEGEHVAIRTVEQHLYFKPLDRGNRDKDGFDSVGFMSETRIDVLLHKNEEPAVPILRTNEIPFDGDIVYHDQTEGRSLQQRIRIYQSAWWFTRHQVQYTTIDKAQAPQLREMTEQRYMEDLGSRPLLRVSRNLNPLYDDATGAPLTTTSEISTSMGPDGLAGSGLRMVGADGAWTTMPGRLNGDFSLIFWCRRAAGSEEAFLAFAAVDLAAVRLIAILVGTDEDSGQTSIVFTDDGINPDYVENVDGAYEDWRMFAVVRQGNQLSFYDGYTLIATRPLNVIVDYGDIALIAVEPISQFDTTVVPQAVSAEALQFYYNDVTRNHGQIVLKPF